MVFTAYHNQEIPHTTTNEQSRTNGVSWEILRKTDVGFTQGNYKERENQFQGFV